MNIRGKILRNPSEEELNEFLLNVKVIISFDVVIAEELVESDRMLREQSLNNYPEKVKRDVHYVYIIYIPYSKEDM